MKMRIDEIIMRKDLYPRIGIDWMTWYSYAKAMEAGSKLPPIAVSKNKILIDGWHTVAALKRNKEEYAEVEVVDIETDDEIFIEAVRRNIKHGRPFSPKEKTMIIQRLMKMNLSLKEISKIVWMPEKDIKPYLVRRLVYAPTGEVIAIKAPLQHLSGKIVNADLVEEAQSRLAAQSQIHLLDQVIDLLETGLIDLDNIEIRIKLNRIVELIRSLL